MNAVFNPGLLNLSTVDVLGQMVLDCGERASLWTWVLPNSYGEVLAPGTSRGTTI